VIKSPRLSQLLWRLLSTAAACLLAAAGILFVLRKTIVRLVFERGEFTAQNTAHIASILGVFCLGVVPLGVAMILVRYLTAVRATWLYAAAGISAAAVYWVFAAQLAQGLGARGLALANVLGNTWLCLALLGGALLVARRRRSCEL
jgi:putative peptidoglycan lipid II flippase